MPTSTRPIPVSDLRRLRDALLAEADQLAPRPGPGTAAAAPALIAYHAARGSALQWLHTVAEAAGARIHGLDQAVRGHYAAAGITAHIAGTISNQTAEHAARRAVADRISDQEAAAVLLDALADAAGSGASATAEQQLQADLDAGRYPAILDRLAATYGVGRHLIIDGAKRAAGITW